MFLFTWLVNFSDLTQWECMALIITFYNLLLFLNTFGKKINISELVMLIFSIQILFMPVVTYVYHHEQMPLDSETYLSFTVPAIIAVNLGFSVRFYKLAPHNVYIDRVKQHLLDKEAVVLTLFGIGVIATLLNNLVPISIRHIVNLFSTTLYISVLYGLYTRGKYKMIVFAITVFIMLSQTISEGMFGHLFIWTILWLSYYAIELKWANTLRFKALLIVLGIFLLVVVQAVKFQYRMATWGEKLGERRGDTELMTNLLIDKVSDLDNLVDSEVMFSAFNRLNQGTIVANTMNHVPQSEPYADGEILKHFFYPFIPRLIWSEKPITGGYENMKRFANIENRGNQSSNISPIGEGYVNFGVTGGIVFMFFYALLFNYLYQLFFKLSVNRPSLFLWIPSTFFATLGIETDVLSIWGRFITGSIFLIFIFQAFRRLNIKL